MLQSLLLMSAHVLIQQMFGLKFLRSNLQIPLLFILYLHHKTISLLALPLMEFILQHLYLMNHLLLQILYLLIIFSIFTLVFLYPPPLYPHDL
jgi:hypothetical protein